MADVSIIGDILRFSDGSYDDVIGHWFGEWETADKLGTLYVLENEKITIGP